MKSTPVYDAITRKNKDFRKGQGNIEVVRKLQEAIRNNKRIAAWKLKLANDS